VRVVALAQGGRGRRRRRRDELRRTRGGRGGRVAFSNRPPGMARGEWYLRGRDRAPGRPCDVGSHAGRTMRQSSIVAQKSVNVKFPSVTSGVIWVSYEVFRY
jgi:hypothetical protein